MANHSTQTVRLLRSEHEQDAGAAWPLSVDAVGVAVLEVLDSPPVAPQRWLTVDDGGSVHKAAATRGELVARYGGTGIDCCEAIAVCPCGADHDDCACKPDCQGQCWDGKPAPAGAWHRIVNLANIPPVPVVRDGRCGWANVTWHDHVGAEGGTPEVPHVSGVVIEIGEWACEVSACTAHRRCGEIFEEVVVEVVDDTEDPPRVVPTPLRAMSDAAAAWAAAGDDVRRALRSEIAANEWLLGADASPPGTTPETPIPSPPLPQPDMASL